jgi:hypothetical protein
MANKQNFTPEEWTKISESVMLAGMAVSAAEPSGLWGTLKEAFASSSTLATAKADAGSNELIKAIIADFESSEGRSAIQEALRKRFAGAKPADVVQRSLANLKEVSAILNASWRCGGFQGLAANYQPEGGRGIRGRRLSGYWRCASQRG